MDIFIFTACAWIWAISYCGFVHVINHITTINYIDDINYINDSNIYTVLSPLLGPTLSELNSFTNSYAPWSVETCNQSYAIIMYIKKRLNIIN